MSTINIETLNANLPESLSAREHSDGTIAVWEHPKSRNGAGSRVALYSPDSDTYKGDEEETFRAALIAPQPGSPAAREAARTGASFSKIRAAAKRGEAALVCSDDELYEAVQAGAVSVSDAMNQDL